MSSSKELSTAIILAAVLIAASLAFLGWQVKQPQDVIDEEQLAGRIKENILAELKSDDFLAAQKDTLLSALKEENFIDDAVDAGVQRYIENQQEAVIDEEQLAGRIKENIQAELKSDDFLSGQKDTLLSALKEENFIDDAVDAGIQRYIKNQQEAQRKAQEERSKLAQEKAKNVPKISERDHIYGNPEATISLIEYSDFECPFCKSFHQNPKDVVDAFEGKVNLVYRHYPLQFHNPGAQKQAEASECAGELGGSEAFWNYADLIYERTTSNGKGFPLENLVPLAEEIGLDKAAFQECFESERYAKLVQQDLKDGQASGITGTPGTIILNNDSGAAKLVSGAQPVDALKKAVEELLN